MSEVTLEVLIERVRALMPETLENLRADIAASPDVDVPFDAEGASVLLWVDMLPAHIFGYDIAVNAIVVRGRYNESLHGEYAPVDAVRAWYNSTPSVIVGSLKALSEMFSTESNVIELLQRAANRAKKLMVAA